MNPTVLALIVSYLHARQRRCDWHIPRTRLQLQQVRRRFLVGWFLESMEGGKL